jgi:hypothetical protein
MAKYTFQCKECKEQKIVYTSTSTKEVDCDCGGSMKRMLPKLNGPADVTETVDNYTGIVWKDGQKDLVQQRKQEYFWKHQVPRLVNSGTYSVETMLENGWITINEKGDFVINDKPPFKR